MSGGGGGGFTGGDDLLSGLMAGWADRGIGSKIDRKGYLNWWTNDPGASSGSFIQGLTNHRISVVDGANWYDPAGKANWAFGVGAALTGIKGGLNAERMYGEGVRRGLAGNYTLTGRNLSQFRRMPATNASMPISSVAKWAKGLGIASFGLGIIMDRIAVANGKISKEKANFNAIMGIYGLTGVGTIPSMLYFGIDSFYPGGWDGAMIDTKRRQTELDNIVNKNSDMPRQYIFPYGSQKF